jgi:hypothetical protein
MSSARLNHSERGTAETSVLYASGAFKNVYKGKYKDGERAGQECVSKVFKERGALEQQYFDAELAVVAKAMQIIDRFNKDRIIDKPIWLNQPELWQFSPGGKCGSQLCLVEPLIANFEKFNSNTGWSPAVSSPWIAVMQALSHYSFHVSGGTCLLCDLQGGVYKNGFVLTDPVIMSTSRQYGPTDLGYEGIATFFNRHVCNKYCRSTWIVSRDQRRFLAVTKGTTMNHLPTLHGRAPLTRPR